MVVLNIILSILLNIGNRKWNWYIHRFMKRFCFLYYGIGFLLFTTTHVVQILKFSSTVTMIGDIWSLFISYLAAQLALSGQKVPNLAFVFCWNSLGKVRLGKGPFK